MNSKRAWKLRNSPAELSEFASNFVRYWDNSDVESIEDDSAGNCSVHPRSGRSGTSGKINSPDDGAPCNLTDPGALFADLFIATLMENRRRVRTPPPANENYLFEWWFLDVLLRNFGWNVYEVLPGRNVIIFVMRAGIDCLSDDVHLSCYEIWDENIWGNETRFQPVRNFLINLMRTLILYVNVNCHFDILKFEIKTFGR